jgi:hypothetical protein
VYVLRRPPRLRHGNFLYEGERVVFRERHPTYAVFRFANTAVSDGDWVCPPDALFDPEDPT